MMETKMTYETLQDVEETMFFEVHCSKCNELLGYYMETNNFPQAYIVKVICQNCNAE